MLEVDRGTEPKTSKTARKSYAKSIEQYRVLVEEALHKAHYGLSANLLILWVFSMPSNEMRFLDMVGSVGGKLAKVTLTQSWPEWGLVKIPREIQVELFNKPWNRANNSCIKISKP